LPSVIKTINWFESLDYKSFGEPKEDMYERTKEKTYQWTIDPVKFGILKEKDAQKALQTIQDYKDTTKMQSNMVIFVPWHMHDDGFPNFVLVDIEHAGVDRPYHYDLAYFYHRAYTKLLSPELARQFLSLFLASNTESHFFEYFLPQLTSRVIGGFNDHIRDKDYLDSNAKIIKHSNDLLDRVFSRDLNRLLAE
jgi:hypothetical protein